MPFQITSPEGQKIDRFVYAYLIYGDEICLIDSGVAHCQRIIIDYLQATGRKPEDITQLILTHAHPDHIGSAAAIKSMTGCTVYAHASERAWIEDTNRQARERPVPGFFTLVGGSVSVDKTLQEGDVLHLGGDLRLRVLHTPGHSSGSISLLLAEDGALITSDAVPIPNDMPIYQDIFASIKSVKKLAALPNINVLLSAWDEPRREGDARRVLSEGLRYLEHIHETVLRVAGEGLQPEEQEARLDPPPEMDPLDLCRKVLVRLGLPPVMANPLVAASFQSSLMALEMQHRLDRRFEGEEKIVWLKDRDFLAKMGYVLENWQIFPIRTGPVRAPAGEVLIGYAVLKKTVAKAKEGGFYRRIFTRKAETLQKNVFSHGLPTEAVDPLQVVAGRPSRRIQPQR
ncbi:MAG: MBL fold metallo-hydrolase [Methanothrix sp.]|nr:MBL fold metallo-hydrolase [Methanothrix sp.]